MVRFVDVKATVCMEAQQGASYSEILALARVAEQEGFDGFFLSDHYLRMGSLVGVVDGLPGPSDAWVTLAGLARDTKTVGIGTLVNSATFRLPVPVAIAVAQVDAMSGGRVTLGLGAGWFEAEHKAQGIPFPAVAERFDRLEEQLAIITGFWRNPVGQTFNFAGRFYQVDGSPALPKPLQSPAPPVIVGGAGRTRTPNLAARFADEFNSPFMTIADGAKQFQRVLRACEAVDRDPSTLRLSAGAIVCCGENTKELQRRADAIGLDLTNPPEGAICGTPAQVIERMSQWGVLGATRMHLQIDDFDHDHVRLLGEAVLPHLT